MQSRKIVLWVIRIIVAAILVSVIWIKFQARPESIYVFTKIGLGPWGRMSSGVIELIAVLLLLIPRTTGWGALLLIFAMTSIIFFHLSSLGIEVMNDGGQLFYKAVVVWVGSAILFIIYRGQVLRIVNRVLNRI